MTWSFSRLNSFCTCKRGWYIQYILDKYGEGNFFSDYGLHFHKTMELYDKGKMELFDLIDYYQNNFNEVVCHSAPPNKYVDLYDSYFNKGLKYLEEFDGHKDKTISAEKEIKFTLNHNGKDRSVVGYIDRLSMDENGLVITDYKSKSKFTNKAEKEHYLIQLYLYSIAIFNEYGEYPYLLRFNMFKEGLIVDEKFNMESLEKAKQWVFDTIDSILSEKEFNKKTGDYNMDFFCNNLCSSKEICFETELG